MEPDPGLRDPVLVLGNGPVGQSAALLLASWKIPVILLDHRPSREPVDGKAICQQRDVLDIWAHVGAGDQIAEEGLTWDLAVTFHRDQELFREGFVDTGISPYPAFVNIGQHRTEQILDERIAAQPLIDVRWGHHVAALTQDDAGVHLVCRLESGPRAGQTCRIDGSYAVASPGSQGDDLRQLLGLSFDGTTFADRFLICDVKTELPDWQHERRFYFDPDWNPGRQVLIHPCPDSTYRIDWQVPPDYDLAAEEVDGRLDGRIRRIVGDAPYQLVSCGVYRFHARSVERMRVGRVLVAGDAAHLVSPFGARGLNSGVQDAENAAWKIAFVVRGWAQESLLETYHVERAAAAAENLAVTSATMNFLVPPDEAAWRERRGILHAARTDPSARAQVDSGRLAEAFWYVDSPLTSPDPTRPFPGRPPKGETPMPAPGICAPDVPVHWEGATRLRQVLRRGITVLLGPGAEAHAAAIIAELACIDSKPPLRVLAMRELSGPVAPALGARVGEVWVVRPDAYIAAALPGAGAAAAGQPAAVAATIRALLDPGGR